MYRTTWFPTSLIINSIPMKSELFCNVSYDLSFLCQLHSSWSVRILARKQVLWCKSKK